MPRPTTEFDPKGVSAPNTMYDLEGALKQIEAYQDEMRKRAMRIDPYRTAWIGRVITSRQPIRVRRTASSRSPTRSRTTTARSGSRTRS